jgi:hypothetical protein
MNDPILLTGAARSGTSLTAGIIYYCGAFGGQLSGPTNNNKKGMFENRDIRDMVLKPLLKQEGYDPMGQSPLPDPQKYTDQGRADKLRQRMISIMRCQGNKASNIDGKWFYKGAKMSLIWTIFHNAFPKAKWIIVRRKDDDIINSCLKTGFMSKYNDAAGWQRWIDVHKKRFMEMEENGLDVREIWPEDMINGNFTSIMNVVQEMGLSWNKDKILEFITPILWSHKPNGENRCH